jgi:hypothetical protein
MGGLLTRSSVVQGNINIKKQKRKRRHHQQLEVSFEPDVHLIHDENKNEDSNVDFIHGYESWQPQRMMNTNGKI